MARVLKLFFFLLLSLNVFFLVIFFKLAKEKDREKITSNLNQKRLGNQIVKTQQNERYNDKGKIEKDEIKDFVYVIEKKDYFKEFKIGETVGYRLDGWIDNFKKDTGEITISKDFKNLVPDYRFKISPYTKLQVIVGIDKNNQLVTREIDYDELKRGSVVTLICSDKKCNSILSVNVINKFAID